jgi:hypothetical protein
VTLDEGAVLDRIDPEGNELAVSRQTVAGSELECPGRGIGAVGGYVFRGYRRLGGGFFCEFRL